MEHPSGQQFILRRGEQQAVITEVGGGLRSYRIGALDVLDGFDDTEICDGARGQTLLPWPNRVKDGRYHWDGHDQQLPLTEPEKHNAIHGLTRWANWELIELTSTSIHLRHRLHAQTGWPFLLRCDLHYSLDQDGLTAHTTVTNLGNQPSPLAAGAHPYLSAGGALIDDCELTVPADTIPTDRRTRNPHRLAPRRWNRPRLPTPPPPRNNADRRDLHRHAPRRYRPCRREARPPRRNHRSTLGRQELSPPRDFHRGHPHLQKASTRTRRGTHDSPSQRTRHWRRPADIAAAADSGVPLGSLRRLVPLRARA